MSKIRTTSTWKGRVSSSIEDTVAYWKEADVDFFQETMGQSLRQQKKWIRVALDRVKPGESIFEPGTGLGYTIEMLHEESPYYGCDVNEEFIQIANKNYPRENALAEVANLYDKLDEWESKGIEQQFDHVIITSLFGFFPETEVYKLIPRFWNQAKLGMSITGLNRDKYSATFKRERKNAITDHDTEYLSKFLSALPRMGEVEMHAEVPIKSQARKFVVYCTRI